MSDIAPQAPPPLQYYTDTGPPQVPALVIRIVYVVGIVIAVLGLLNVLAAIIALAQQIWGAPGGTRLRLYNRGPHPVPQLVIAIAAALSGLILLIGCIAGLWGNGAGRRAVMIGALAMGTLHTGSYAFMMIQTYSSFSAMPMISWLDKFYIIVMTSYYAIHEVVYALLAIAILWKRGGQQ